MTELPERASAVIVGGGVIGASVAYHLVRRGWSEVLLLERRQFTCGTTWHAAGLIGTVRTVESHARLAGYSLNLLRDLERETGQSTGLRQVGSLTIAQSRDRWEELKRIASMNAAFGVTRVEQVTPEEIRSLYPLLETRDLLGGTWVAQDGQASPVDVTMALLKGARAGGALCLENVRVIGIRQRDGRVAGVLTDRGEVRTGVVVNCAGMWGRELGRLAGVEVPLAACEHYYAHTEKLDLPPDLPVLRDHDCCAYYREDAGSLLVGAFEKRARPWGMDGIPEGFCFDELPGHMEAQFLPVLEDALRRVPVLAEAGWRSFFCGPESFTPDGQFHIGEAPELPGFFVGCGLNSVGIQSAGGLGKALADWIDRGHPPPELWPNDIRRIHPVMGTRRFLAQRVAESLGLLYDNHYPYRQFATARDVRHSPVHERLVRLNACFGQVGGWERPNWFAPAGVEPEYDSAFGRQNWFGYAAAEHRAAREGVALFDQSSFSKYLIAGRDACRVLQRVCTADVDVEPGRIVYTHWLNPRGTIEAEVTVTRLAEDRYWVIGGAATARRDLDWLARQMPDDARCFVHDISNAWAVFGVMGPASRVLLGEVLDVDLSREAFPFGRAREVEIGCATGRAHRVSYVGELGWELYVPVEQSRHSFDEILRVGAGHGLTPAGMHALDSCRIEKKFVHYGHDIGDGDTPPEAGLGFVCAFDKAVAFIGRDAVLRQRETERPLRRRLVQCLLTDPEVMLYQHEPLRRDGEIVGYLTSGAYGHTLGGSVGLGYVRHRGGVDRAWIEAGDWTVEVGGERIPARVGLRALYDPGGERMRG
ncbi:MAG: FAD-dependent oxidoreductase [Candidatus Competibacterales bacterium]|nr:FAD-dependent oxidoreductase [Candidatus Competibacterales bacterium]